MIVVFIINICTFIYIDALDAPPDNPRPVRRRQRRPARPMRHSEIRQRPACGTPATCVSAAHCSSHPAARGTRK